MTPPFIPIQVSSTVYVETVFHNDADKEFNAHDLASYNTRSSTMLAGLAAGSVAAVAAALVSLPLRSPDDILFNSATVVVGALFTGAAIGLIWRILADRQDRVVWLGVSLLVGLATTSLLAIIGETQLDHFAGFAIPLAAIALLLVGILTPLIAGSSFLRRRWSVPVSVMLALAIGIALAGQGDEESGRLELPPRSTISESPFGT